jgi:hypothetical protein
LDASVDAVQQFNVWWTAAPADWWLCLRPSVAPCLDGVGSNPDARLTGPIDTFQNGTGYSSQDGTCTGTILVPLETIVSDADAPTATAHCLTLDASVDAVQQFNVWWTAAPADWWLCLRPGGH